MRVLDEVAYAICSVRGRFIPLLSEFDLQELLELLPTPERWAELEHFLGCSLPPLDFVQGHWFLPDGFETLWDLVDHVSLVRPDWDPPAEYTVVAWRNAQIFAGVRRCLADAGSLDEKDIFRESRLKADLGLV